MTANKTNGLSFMSLNDKFFSNINEKEATILKSIIYDYIVTGKPVGSRSFVQKYSFAISPATMRNIMSDLEKMGFLTQPHTSAGRSPTDQGYRFYVDSLLNNYNYDSFNEKINVKEPHIKKELGLDDVFNSILQILCQESKYASIILTPKLDYTVVKRIELVPLDDDEVLLILVTRTGMIINRKINLSNSIMQENLHKYSNFLTSELCGYALFEIKNEIFSKLRQEKKNLSFDHNLALDIAELAFSNSEDPKLYMKGIENLLKIPEMIEKDKINSILQIIENKEILGEIMGNMLHKEGVSILIGQELPYSEITNCSLIVTNYKIGTKAVGALGIIGPTRMDYQKNVPLIDYAGKFISDLLNKISK